MIDFGNWRRAQLHSGPCNWAIISDKPTGHDDDRDISYYGGHLVCESVGRPETTNLIIAAPRLLQFADLIAGFTPPAGDDDNAETLRSLIRSARALRDRATGAA